MTDVKIKQELIDSWLDEPIKSDTWRVIGFLRCGRIFNGHLSYPSEERAQKAIIKWENETQKMADEKGVDVWCAHENAQFFFSQYVYAIPMPGKE